MSLIQTEILTPWMIVEDLVLVNKPLLLQEYSVYAFQDESDSPKRPPEPNISIASAKVTVESNVLEQIKTDNRFYILWSEEIP